MEGIFNRSQLLLGDDVMARLAAARIILFGVGGVGSWCAESLVRTGIGHLTIVDSDRVATSNINRQLMATAASVGRVKVEALRERLLEINPEASVTAIQQVYNSETSASFDLASYDYVIDCIDSLREKCHLLETASSIKGVTVFSSMGAALKLDPRRIEVAEFWKVKGCPLAAAMRARLRKAKEHLGSKVICVYSEERRDNRGTTDERPEGYKASVNGSLVHITGIYGFTLAGLVIQSIVNSD